MVQALSISFSYCLILFGIVDVGVTQFGKEKFNLIKFISMFFVIFIDVTLLLSMIIISIVIFGWFITCAGNYLSYNVQGVCMKSTHLYYLAT